MKIIFKILVTIIKIIFVIIPVELFVLLLVPAAYIGFLAFDFYVLNPLDPDIVSTTEKFNNVYKLEERYGFSLPEGGELVEEYHGKGFIIRPGDDYYIYQYSNESNFDFVEIGFENKDSFNINMDIFNRTFNEINVPEEHIFDINDEYIIRVTYEDYLPFIHFLYYEENNLLYIYVARD